MVFKLMFGEGRGKRDWKGERIKVRNEMTKILNVNGQIIILRLFALL